MDFSRKQKAPGVSHPEAFWKKIKILLSKEQLLPARRSGYEQLVPQG